MVTCAPPPRSKTALSATASFEVRSPKLLQVKFEEGRVATPQLLADLALPSSLELLGQQVDLTPLQVGSSLLAGSVGARGMAAPPSDAFWAGTAVWRFCCTRMPMCQTRHVGSPRAADVWQPAPGAALRPFTACRPNPRIAPAAAPVLQSALQPLEGPLRSALGSLGGVLSGLPDLRIPLSSTPTASSWLLNTYLGEAGRRGGGPWPCPGHDWHGKDQCGRCFDPDTAGGCRPGVPPKHRLPQRLHAVLGTHQAARDPQECVHEPSPNQAGLQPGLALSR